MSQQIDDQVGDMSIRSNKLWTIILLCLSLTALMILSAGINGLDFTYGKPFSTRSEVETGTVGVEPLTFGEGYFNFIFALIAVFLISLPIALIFLISSKDRKRIIRVLLPPMWLAIIYLLIRPEVPPYVQPKSGLPETLTPAEPLIADVEPTSAPSTLMEVEFIFTPPQWLVTVMTIGLAILIATLLVSVFLYTQRFIHRKLSPLQQIAQEAQEAMDALMTGADLRNTVIRCYYEMNQVLIKHRGVKRDKSMTPREFERNLERAGVPGEHVRTLTRLFEVVRYGTEVPGEEEERQAIESLSMIVNAIRSSP